MAVEFFDFQAIQRRLGHSACAKASYNSCSTITCPRTGETHSYNRKSGLVYESIFKPNAAPHKTRQDIWGDVELMEKRKDACVARSLTLALPLEFNKSERIELSQSFSQHIANKYQVYADLAIHEPTRRKRNATTAENPHAHIQFPDRNIHGVKLRQLTKGRMGKGAVDEVTMLRKEWEAFVQNYAQKYEKSFTFTMKKKKTLEQRKQEAENELRNIRKAISFIRKSIWELEYEHQRNQSDFGENLVLASQQRRRPSPHIGRVGQQVSNIGKSCKTTSKDSHLSNRKGGQEEHQRHSRYGQKIKLEVTIAHLKDIEQKLKNNLNNKLLAQIQGEVNNGPTIN